MKKAFVAKLALAGTVGVVAALAAGDASAAICSACHTMHNSQNGSPMRLDGVATPAQILLRGDCVYCHTGVNPVAPIPASAQPKVDSTVLPTYSDRAGAGAAGGTLAGGNFYWVGAAGAGDAAGHNVNGFDSEDATLGNTPPGGSDLTVRLECAGTSGCHGDDAVASPLASLSGAHHSAHNTLANSAANIDGTTVGKSFRYLLGVLGYEDSDWQHTENNNTDHNVYQGEARAAANTPHDTTTISGLCAKCHGAYHNTQDGTDSYGISTSNAALASGQWIRHPTDWDMPLTGEYLGYTTYRPESPVGQTNLASAAGVTAATNRIVMCVSCHRAHGSPYADALRWSYGEMEVGLGVTHGCMNCHTAK